MGAYNPGAYVSTAGGILVPGPPLPVPSDPLFAKVILLCHFDGTNGSTVFTDSSSYNRFIDGYLATQLRTDIKVFGTAALRLRETHGEYLYALNAPELEVADNDFCVEGRIYRESSGTYASIVSCNHNAPSGPSNYGYGVHISNLNKLFFYGYSGASELWSIYSTTSVTTGAFYSFKCTKQGGVVSLALNGIEEATTSFTNAAINFDSLHELYVGRFNSFDYRYFHGRIDELRITADGDRGIGNYTVPTEPFLNV